MHAREKTNIRGEANFNPQKKKQDVSRFRLSNLSYQFVKIAFYCMARLLSEEKKQREGYVVTQRSEFFFILLSRSPPVPGCFSLRRRFELLLLLLLLLLERSFATVRSPLRMFSSCSHAHVAHAFSQRSQRNIGSETLAAVTAKHLLSLGRLLTSWCWWAIGDFLVLGAVEWGSAFRVSVSPSEAVLV